MLIYISKDLNVFYYEKKETGIFHQNRRTISNMVGVRFRNIQLYEAIRAIISLSMSCNQLNNIEKLDRIMVDYMEVDYMDLEITPKAHFLTHYNELIRFYGTFNHIQRSDSNQRMAKKKDLKI